LSTDTIHGFDLDADTIDILAIAQAGWNASLDASWDDGTDTLSIDLDGDSVYDMQVVLEGLTATADEVYAAIVG